MKNNKTKTIIMGLTASVVVAMLLWILKVALDRAYILEPAVTVREITFHGTPEHLFIYRIEGGISGGHIATFISSQSKRHAIYDSLTDYRYRGDDIIYGTHGDTLEVFTSSLSPTPSSFGTQIHVLQHQLENPEMMKLLETYKKQGLERIVPTQ